MVYLKSGISTHSFNYESCKYYTDNRRTAVANPVVVAEFFTLTINAFFTALIRLGSTTGGILGPVSDYAAVVETNGRGMLHSHGFILYNEVMIRPQKILIPGYLGEYVDLDQPSRFDQLAGEALSQQHH